MTPDGKRNVTNAHNKGDAQTNENNANVPGPTAPKATEEDFFEMLTRTQSKRMDDQRCSLKVIGHSQSQTSREPPIRKPLVQQNSLPAVPTTPQTTKENRNALLEMIADLQSERMDEQRAQLPTLPGLVPSPQNQNTRRNLINNQTATRNNGGSSNEPAPDDAFLDMLMRCQGSRLEEQRSELPRTNDTLDMEQGEPPNNNRRNCVNNNTNNAGATVPDEDFFSLIMRVQGGRMEDQRAAVSSFDRLEEFLNGNFVKPKFYHDIVN